MKSFDDLPPYDPRHGGFIHKEDNLYVMRNDCMERYFTLSLPQFLELWGKWLFFDCDLDLLVEKCKLAARAVYVELSEVSFRKTAEGEYEAGLYVPYTDIDAHKRAVMFLLDNNLIKRTREGRLYNMSFKTGVDYALGNHSGNGRLRRPLRLEHLVDLKTGIWRDISEAEFRKLLEPTVVEGLLLM